MAISPQHMTFQLESAPTPAILNMATAYFLRGLPRVPTAERPSDTCMICLRQYGVSESNDDVAEVAVRLPCDHVMGLGCITTWLTPAGGGRNNSCPYCRHKLFYLSRIFDGVDGESGARRRVPSAWERRVLELYSQHETTAFRPSVATSNSTPSNPRATGPTNGPFDSPFASHLDTLQLASEEWNRTLEWARSRTVSTIPGPAYFSSIRGQPSNAPSYDPAYEPPASIEEADNVISNFDPLQDPGSTLPDERPPSQAPQSFPTSNVRSWRNENEQVPARHAASLNPRPVQNDDYRAQESGTHSHQQQQIANDVPRGDQWPRMSRDHRRRTVQESIRDTDQLVDEGARLIDTAAQELLPILDEIAQIELQCPGSLSPQSRERVIQLIREIGRDSEQLSDIIEQAYRHLEDVLSRDRGA